MEIFESSVQTSPALLGKAHIYTGCQGRTSRESEYFEAKIVMPYGVRLALRRAADGEDRGHRRCLTLGV